MDNNFYKNNYIIQKLNKLYETKNIPNIIFYGTNLTGKKTYLEYLIKIIYKNNDNIKKYVLIINCSHGKGNIKFIRENIKHFANTIINNNDNYLFKSIILINADKLTIDAQSALRRCIEIYNHSTRFFIIVDDKFKILKPILSRFSDIYCDTKINNFKENKLYDFYSKKIYYLNKFIIFNKDIDNLHYNNKIIYIFNLTYKLYNNGFSGNMLLQYIKNKIPDSKNKYKFLFIMNIYKKELRNELLIIIFCLNYIYFRNNINLENINLI
tara:strand:+ start:3161 stop:3964 length:804 start_codon:yes stop_codon:yes gene_type:complete